MYDQCHNNGKKWIWSIGGASDLKFGIKDDQIASFVDKVKFILSKAGDGVDLDFEHMSSKDDDSLLNTYAKMVKLLRAGLDEAGMQDKTIGYTTRYNAAWNEDTSPDGWTNWNTDGEAMKIDTVLQSHGGSLASVVDYVNIMFYDQDPTDLDAPNGLKLKNYQTVLEAFEKIFPKNKLIMGFEPGPQFNNGKWEGAEVDHAVIDHLKQNGYGGVFFWAINQPEVGDNALELAEYA